MTPTVDPIRVMVVDDSAVVRGFWARIVDAEDDMRVVASAWNGRSALDVLARKEVDIVLLDVEMPEMDGMEALPLILDAHPHARVIMASSLTSRGAEVTVTALSLGAADYVTKPDAGGRGPGMAEVGRELVRKIRVLARRRVRKTAAPTATPPPPPPPMPRRRAAAPRVLAITSSTGGPNALTEVLGGLPRDYPLPILVVQHMPPMFTEMLAARLERETGRPCREARSGETMQGGHTYVAPGDFHMLVHRKGPGPILELTREEPENFCRPSADPLFRSAAAAFGEELLCVVLTGMGQDGLEGARAAAAKGAAIVAQDEATSVVWGMPGAVVGAGLAHAVLPLGEIAAHIDAATRAFRC